MGQVSKFFRSLASNKLRLVVVLILIAAVGFVGYKKIHAGSTKPQYQTDTAQKGTLIKTVTASGVIASSNNVEITTGASGVITNVYVKNGDNVSAGQVIADLAPDRDTQQKQSQAYESMLQAESSLNSANADLNTLQNTEFTANQKFINDAVARGLTTSDPTYIEENSAWLAAEANYKNQQNVIAQSQAAVNNAALSYQQVSSTITAPVAGTVTGLSVAPGSQVAGSGTSSTTSTTIQSIGSVVQPGPTQAQVDISEIDSVNVSVGQKVTMTLDAFPNQTFTGRVLSVNTNGVVSSGVTTYPATIAFDVSNPHIYPNMGVSANIITNVEDDVLLVPNAAVQSQGGQTTVRILKNGQVQTVPVQTGDSNDTDTVITSGLSEGDTVVTGVLNLAPTGSSGGTSPFSATRGGFGGGGGAVFRGGGGRGG